MGVLATVGPSDRLLTMLNEPPAGSGLILPLAAGWLLGVSIPVLAAAWPAWRAAGRPPVALLQGAGIASGRGSRPRRARAGCRAGLAALGARLVAARRGRLAATVITLSVSTAFVLLLLALASALSVLETDPGALGKRYQLTSSVPAAEASVARSVPGVQAAAPRYELQAADSFSLGETIDVIAYPGDHTIFEAPPLTAGRRLRGADEAEVGAGLADALGLSPGSTLAIALPVGRRAAAARRWRRQLARPRRTRRVHTGGGVVAGRPLGARGDRDPPGPGRRSDAVIDALTALGAAADAGDRRDRPRGAARRHAADDSAGGRDRRRARVRVRADPGVRADAPGAATDGRRVTRDAEPDRRPFAGCWPASCWRS